MSWTLAVPQTALTNLHFAHWQADNAPCTGCYLLPHTRRWLQYGTQLWHKTVMATSYMLR